MPEGLVAFLERVGPADPDILQHPLVESKQGAALTINRIAIAQPPEHPDEKSAHAERAANGTFQAQGYFMNHGLILQHFTESPSIMEKAY